MIVWPNGTAIRWTLIAAPLGVEQMALTVLFEVKNEKFYVRAGAIAAPCLTTQQFQQPQLDDVFVALRMEPGDLTNLFGQ